MIIPDLNLLVYAYTSDAPFHEPARSWWEELMSGARPVALPWAVSLGFVRLMSSQAVLTRPLSPVEALAHVASWLVRPQTVVLEPGPRHLDILTDIMGRAHASGRLTTDAHLAALAIENQAELHSNDTDLARFSGLRWHNPLP